MYSEKTCMNLNQPRKTKAMKISTTSNETRKQTKIFPAVFVLSSLMNKNVKIVKVKAKIAIAKTEKETKSFKMTSLI